MKHKHMKQDISRYLPSEMITEILSRLPAQNIPTCKCVCKSWLALLETNNFAEFHLSKSVPGLVFTCDPDVMDETIQLINPLDIQHHNLPDLHFSTIIMFGFTDYHATIEASLDGLLLLCTVNRTSKEVEYRLCNPITREYIDLHIENEMDNFGFGVSKITSQYKVVAMLQDNTDTLLDCMVYTLGTGSWRSIKPHALLRYHASTPGAFLNGNLHWLAHDLNGALTISCFDLETDIFTTFSPPPSLGDGDMVLVAVEGSLYLCDYYASNADMYIVWLMKEYGDDKSWRKEFAIERDPDRPLFSYPIRVSKDGVVFTSQSTSLFYHSRENKTTQTISNSRGFVYGWSRPYTPSFLSLKRFGMENPISF